MICIHIVELITAVLQLNISELHCSRLTLMNKERPFYMAILCFILDTHLGMG